MMSKKLIRPTEAENAQITAAALTDPDNLPLANEELRQFRKARGRPQGSGKKEQVTLRLDTDILWSNSRQPAMAGKHALMTRYGTG